MTSDDIFLTYVGKGRGSIFGVPARDLTKDEAEASGIQRLISSGLYRYSEEAKAEIQTTRRTRRALRAAKESE